MKYRQFALLLGVIATICFISFSCRKINNATSLGGGLIPAVDNITTFDTTISVESYGGIFATSDDSLRLLNSDEQFIGRINNDPFFGSTDARLFIQLKPAFFPYSFARKDSLSIDSVVLVLGYVETYGDTTIAQNINVYEIDPVLTNNFKADSAYLVRQNNFTYTNLLGSRTVVPSTLNDSVRVKFDTTSHQLRIRLDNSFGTRLLNYDSTSTGAYSKDSIFNTYFRGFAVQSMGAGNAVIGINPTSNNTKLAIYYRYPKSGGLGNDTTVAYFRFNYGTCAAANHVIRNFTGSPAEQVSQTTGQDQLVYIDNAPGTYATIKIPTLDNVSNRLVHRAELIVEQVYDPSDDNLTIPPQLYVEAIDPTLTTYGKNRSIPYDLVYSGTDINRQAFGCYGVNAFDANNKTIKVWKFDLSRYVQHVLTHTVSRYDLRLSAPFSLYTTYGNPPNGATSKQVFIINPSIVKGRVRLGGGNHPTQKMRLRLVYSKI